MEDSTAAAAEHNTFLDCVLCKNVMIEPRECYKCRKGFCKNCVVGYIDQLVAGDYEVVCPNCGSSPFKLMDVHPILAN